MRFSWRWHAALELSRPPTACTALEGSRVESKKRDLLIDGIAFTYTPAVQNPAKRY
jgi:hypothetical protein